MEMFFNKKKEQLNRQNSINNNSVAVYLKKDEEIIDKIDKLYQKIEGIEKSNKKFLMTANALFEVKQDSKEDENTILKLGIIEMLDQIDVLVPGVNFAVTEDIRKGIESFNAKINEIIAKLGIERIKISEHEKFDSKIMECSEKSHLDGYEDDAVTAVIRTGYIDKRSGQVLRYAKVLVNCIEGGKTE